MPCFIGVSARIAWCILAAFLYKLATAPLKISGFLLVPVAIWFGRNQPDITGTRTIFSAPRWLFIYGNSQDGYDPPWAIETLYAGWPTFWRRYSWAAWRNAIRNLPFVPALAFLHKPKGELQWKQARIGGVLVTLLWRGWLTELKWSKGNRFGDFGPRLDQPESWGAVSWAFRPFGRVHG